MLGLLFALVAIQLVAGFYIFLYVFDKFDNNKKKSIIFIGIGSFVAIVVLYIVRILEVQWIGVAAIILNILFAFISFFIVSKSVLVKQKALMYFDLIMNIAVPITVILLFKYYSNYININVFTHEFKNIENISIGIFMTIIILCSVIVTMSIHVTLKYYYWGITRKKTSYEAMIQLTSNKSYIVSALIGMVIGVILLAEAKLPLNGVLSERYTRSLDVFTVLVLAFMLPVIYNYLSKNKNL